MTVRQLCFSPSGYRRLRQAIEAAGLPKKERLGSPYERYMADKDRERDALEKEGVMAMRTMVDVERMLVEINEQGRLPDEASRARYLRSVYGGNPLRRIRKMRKRCERDGVEYRDFRRAGSLACWAPLNGATPFNSRWDRWSGGDGPGRRQLDRREAGGGGDGRIADRRVERQAIIGMGMSAATSAGRLMLSMKGESHG